MSKQKGNLSHGPAETENLNKNDDNVEGNLSHDLPEWPQEFRHGLAHESVPQHTDASSSSHESPPELPGRPASVRSWNKVEPSAVQLLWSKLWAVNIVIEITHKTQATRTHS